MTTNENIAPSPNATKGAEVDSAYAAIVFVATSCACCGRTLTDPLSIEVGMGPICRHDHGFNASDAPEDWGQALGALGQEAPVDLYDAIADAYGNRENPNLRDVRRAVKVLVHRIAVADQRRDTGIIVLRCVMAIQALGYVTLARVLGRALIRRPSLRTLPRAPHVVAMTPVDKKSDVLDSSALFFVQTNAAEWRVKCALRDEKILYTDRDVRGGLYTRAVDQIATRRALVTCGADLVIDAEGVTCTVAFADPEPRERAWWPDACAESDRVAWVSVETGELVRYAVAGEPKVRPGLEKVPACFFAHGADVVAHLGPSEPVYEYVDVVQPEPQASAAIVATSTKERATCTQCGAPVHARGLCKMHYRQSRRAATSTPKAPRVPSVALVSFVVVAMEVYS